MDNKLIELLTEHCRKHYGFKDNDDIEIDTDSICFHLYHKGKRCFSIRIETVICKDFGFIKWLVDNNKIDTQNLITYMNGTSLTFNKVPSTDCTNIDKIWNNFYTECLLMLLSIQDNPIDFLVSIL